jgi:HK97 family phage major capsid protein
MNWQQIKAAKEERGTVIGDMRKMIDKANQEKRDFTAEEDTAYKALEQRAAAKLAEIQRGERLAELERLSGNGNTPSGLEPKDLRNYSLLKAIRAKMEQRSLDGLEREVSDEIALRTGKAAQGFYFPVEATLGNVESRTFLNTTTGTGAVQSTVAANTFIEMFRNKAVMSSLGATVLSGLVGDFKIPRQSGGATAYWVGESTAPTTSNQTLDQVAFAAKTVGAYTDISRKFIHQTSIDAESFVRNDLATTLALAIDSAAINGTGSSNQPTGILATSGIGSVAIGINGGPITWAKLVELETDVYTANAAQGKLAYLTNAAQRGKMKSIERATNTAKFLMDDDGTANGYPVAITNAVPSTLTKGTSAGVCSAMIFGNWADLVVAMWGGLDILVDPFTGGNAGTVRINALQDVDINVRHAASFAAVQDLT